MAFCNSIELTIDMDEDLKHTRLATLFFDLTIAGGVISGEVRHADLTLLSSVSGSCQSVASPDVGVMTLLFNWDTVVVFMTGFVYQDQTDLRIKFIGRFLALAGDTPAKSSTPSGQGAPPEPPPPGDGDTGTGTGQQT